MNRHPNARVLARRQNQTRSQIREGCRKLRTARERGEALRAALRPLLASGMRVDEAVDTAMLAAGRDPFTGFKTPRKPKVVPPCCSPSPHA